MVEGRLLAMLDGVRDLTLTRLNALTQAWVERDYHRNVHAEIHTTPLERFVNAPSALRPAPSPEWLRDVFGHEVQRKIRRSDATLTLDGVRFEVPTRLAHFPALTLRYARWDLGRVQVIDPRTGRAIARIFPLDRARNATGERRARTPPVADLPIDHPAPPADAGALPPLLERLVRDDAASGLPPSYLPSPTPKTEKED